VDERLHRVRGGGNRQGREKRRRRTGAGMEPRDEVRRDHRSASRGGTTGTGPAVRAAGRCRGKTPYREVDSSGWERRRGEQSYGRRIEVEGRRTSADPEPRSGSSARSSRVSARSWVVPRPRWKQRSRRPGGTRQGPGREAKDAGGAAKPEQRLHRVVRRRRSAQRRGGPGNEGAGEQRRETGRWRHRNGPERATRPPDSRHTRFEILRKENRGLK
jgi:hypothetical protein